MEKPYSLKLIAHTKSKFSAYLKLMRFHRPIGTLLLLWPVLWSLWVASQGVPHLKILMIMSLGVIVMRAAGCVINDIADRNFDGWVARTKDRPLATGEISIKQASLLFIVLLFCALLLVLCLNKLTIMLAFIAALLTVFYPFTKRFFVMPQLILAAAFNWGIPMAFAAELNRVPGIAWLVFSIAFVWTVYYDTLYAMTDKADDLKLGLKSSAIFFGKADKIILTLLQFLFLILLLVLGHRLNMAIYYYLGLIVVSAFLIYQQVLARHRAPQRCFQAFINNQWVGLIIFLAIGLGQLK